MPGVIASCEILGKQQVCHGRRLSHWCYALIAVEVLYGARTQTYGKDFFEPVRFSTDIDDLFDAHLLSPQQPDSSLAGLSRRVCALRTGTEFVFHAELSRKLLLEQLPDSGGSPLP